jgi:DNA-binding NarL/FixJ family response regulator
MTPDDFSVRVLLLNGQPLFREAVGRVLEDVSDFQIVAETDDPAEAVSEAARANPNVALLDADQLDSGLPAFVDRIKSAAPDCKVLVITSDSEVGPVVGALEAGASGYITQDASIEELITATRNVSRGEVVIPPQMVGSLLAMLIGQRASRDDALEKLSRLTRREREVLALLADGSDKDAIAGALYISPHTARTHVQNILAKLGLHSRLEAAAFARKQPVLRRLVSAR